MTDAEAKKPQESLQDRLTQVVDLLHRQRLVEELTHRQEGPHHQLVEDLVHSARRSAKGKTPKGGTK